MLLMERGGAGAMSGGRRCAGRRDGRDPGLGVVVARHEALRTRFAVAEGGPVQLVTASVPVPLPVTDLRGLPQDEREAAARERMTAAAREPFDLERGPLLRASLYRLGGERWILCLLAHHIVIDFASTDVMVRELAACYDPDVRQRPP